MTLRLGIDVGTGTLSLDTLRTQFPAIDFDLVRAPASLTVESWRADDFDFWAFDRMLDELAAHDRQLVIAARATEAAAIVQQVAIRAQRIALRRNAASQTPWFDRVLDEHRVLHDISKPLVRADYDHALDTWQWTLRRDPHVSVTVQLAALLHDIERLASEADRRIEHRAPDYQVFKDAHARASAQIAAGVLARARVPAKLAAGAAALIACHERAWPNPLARAINDADALSFFSLNSAGYVSYFGPEHTAKKVAYTLARMSADARRELASVRLPRLVQELLSRRPPCESSSSDSR